MSAADDQLEGRCEFWNGYFIAQSAAVLVLIAINGALSYHRSKAPSRSARSGDWGLPWSICIFLFSLGIWNLGPLCLFFLLFDGAFPASFEEGEQMACLTIQNLPFLTIVFVLLGFSVLIGYNAVAARKSLASIVANDNDILRTDDQRVETNSHTTTAGDEVNPPEPGSVHSGASAATPTPQSLEKKRKHHHQPRVLMLQAGGRGNFLIERLRRRQEYLNGVAGATFVAHTAVVFYPYEGYELQRDHTVNNMAVEGGFEAGETYYSVHDAHVVSRENAFGLPFRDCSMDKVLLSPMFRQMPPVASSFMTSETHKAARMHFVLREALRVVRPGGKIVFANSANDAVLCYADMRDLVGEQHVTINENVGSLRVGLLKNVLFCVTAVKPDDYAAPEASVSVLQQLAPPVPTTTQHMMLTSEEDERKQQVDNISTLFSSPLIADPLEPALDEGQILSVMLPIQVIVSLALLFGSAALYPSLDWPTSIPVSQRVGNLPISIATSYPLFAYFEREIILTTAHFKARLEIVRVMLLSTGISIFSSIVFTAILGLPQLGMQVALLSTGLNSSVRSIIGYAISALLGNIVYRYSKYKRISATLSARGLPEKYRKHFR